MPFIYRSGYGFTDLLNDFENNFFVFYLRGLHGFDSNSHFVTSFVTSPYFTRQRLSACSKLPAGMVTKRLSLPAIFT